EGQRSVRDRPRIGDRAAGGEGGRGVAAPQIACRRDLERETGGRALDDHWALDDDVVVAVRDDPANPGAAHLPRAARGGGGDDVREGGGGGQEESGGEEVHPYHGSP